MSLKDSNDVEAKKFKNSKTTAIAESMPISTHLYVLKLIPVSAFKLIIYDIYYPCQYCCIQQQKLNFWEFWQK